MKIPKIIHDGWKNVFTGMGMKGQDKRNESKVTGRHFLNQHEVETLYREGIAKNIIDAVPEEMLRRWVTFEEIEGDQVRKLEKKMRQLRIKSKLNSLFKWGRLYGGSVAVMFIRDGGELHEPVNEKAIKSFDGIRVFDRWQVSYVPMNIHEPDLTHDMIPDYIRITPLLKGKPFQVHKSRFLWFAGEELPDRLKLENWYFGDSALMSVFDAIRAYDAVHDSTELIIDGFEQSVISIKNLSEMVASGQEKYVNKRLEILDLSKSVLRTMLLDADGETYTKHSSSLAGLPDSVDKFAARLSAHSRTPQTLLFGRSPAGENATGESDFQQWYDRIGDEQNEHLVPSLERIAYLMLISKEFGLQSNPDFSVEPVPLKQPTEAQEIEMKNKQANTDALYIQNNVLDPSEVAISRFKHKQLTDVDLERNDIE